MTFFVQSDHAKLVPTLPPLLNAVQMHQELVSSLLQSYSLAQQQLSQQVSGDLLQSMANLLVTDSEEAFVIFAAKITRLEPSKRAEEG